MLATLLGAAVALLVMAGLLAPLEGWFPIAPARPRARAMAICAAFFLEGAPASGLEPTPPAQHVT
jgi:hypothetical protein